MVCLIGGFGSAQGHYEVVSGAKTALTSKPITLGRRLAFIRSGTKIP